MSWLPRLRTKMKRPSPVRLPPARRRPILENLESRELLSHSPTRLKNVVAPTVVQPIGVVGPSGPTSPVEIVLDPVADQHFAAGLYNDILNREPSLGEVTGWVNSL